VGLRIDVFKKEERHLGVLIAEGTAPLGVNAKTQELIQDSASFELLKDVLGISVDNLDGLERLD